MLDTLSKSVYKNSNEYLYQECSRGRWIWLFSVTVLFYSMLSTAPETTAMFSAVWLPYLVTDLSFFLMALTIEPRNLESCICVNVVW